MMTRFLLAISLLLLLPSSPRAQEQRRQEPKLKPAPMNPGPLGSAGYIVLAPIDDRPAVGQFARMIGAVADHTVTMPPRDMLGRFTTPGDTAKIESWLRAQNYSKVDALVVSADMLAYGGLVASRRYGVSLDEAKKRLDFFRWFKSKHPNVPIYVFSTIMRIAPTATAETRGIHDKLARWAELQDRAPKTGDQRLVEELGQLTRQLDPKVVENYLAARNRNLQLNLALLSLVKAGTVDELILLQDDARQFGLHRQDQAVLKDRLKQLGIEARVPIYNGADEGSNSLVSRTVLDKFRNKLRVAVVYSSEKSREVIAPYEDHPLQFTVENQIRASGGIPVSEYDKADYTLFVNAPATSEEEFDLFLRKLIKEMKESRYIALADLLFPAPHRSGADERIIAALVREGLIDRFDGYAAWNTAGNTLGTAIPHANMRVFYKTKLNDSVERTARAEVAHLEFLLHRYAGDYIYHDVVRLAVDRRLREEAKDGTVTYQLAPEKYEEVNREVEQRLKAEVGKFFAEHFQNRSYTLAYYNNVKRAITLKGLKDLKIYLPWPRTFEVVVEYKLDYSTN
jgi:hypothetical protein